ncbi:hypothetical protein LCGC14_0234880 [marine sediment metagenome]|uniref:Uncharacterized protein n=1 Tax=marine sediment metagenome TaxID=412755 RepID=A0A0F9UQ43_9ZZZZ
MDWAVLLCFFAGWVLCGLIAYPISRGIWAMGGRPGDEPTSSCVKWEWFAWSLTLGPGVLVAVLLCLPPAILHWFFEEKP